MAQFVKQSRGLTLAEVIVAVALLSIVTTTAVLLFSRGSQVYAQSKAEQESLQRIRAQVPPILKELRGIVRLKSTLSAVNGSPSVAYNAVLTAGGPLKYVVLAWDSTAHPVTRTQYAADANGDPTGPIEVQTTLAANVDFLNFYADPNSSQLVVVDYQLTQGLPSPLTFHYKVLPIPKLPVPVDTSD